MKILDKKKLTDEEIEKKSGELAEQAEILIGDEVQQYWMKRKKMSEQSLINLEADFKVIPMHQKFHKEIIKLCDKKLKDVVKVKI